MSSILPTIGRKVWLWVPSKIGVKDAEQAFDATVIHVAIDGRVDLAYTNHYGTSGAMMRVELRDPQPSDKHDAETEVYATWMPYQVGQAKKDATT